MKKFLAMVLALLMIVSILPLSVIAAENDLELGSGGCDYYNLIEKNDYNLAPGAVESEIIINDDSGSRRQVVHVIEVDPNNENISVMPSFKNISTDVDYTDESNWGIMEMSKQAAYAEETLGKNVVGAMNVCLSWNFTHPYGLLVYEGKVLCDNRASCDTCGSGHPGGGYLVIYKDGKAELRDAMDPLTGDEWMAQTVCFSYIVKDGVSLNATENHSSDPAPRSVIGVKADGSLVIMMVDGRMAPYSTGFNSHEMAEMMLDLGCVDAINCDGGGSSTFITEREGSGELTVKSRFSDGSERPTLSGILIISKAVADGKFDHAAIEADNKLVTPGSTVKFTATGADSAGGPAEIPADVSWQLADTSMGTIENGVFVSNGKVGKVVAQMVYNGNVVGEATAEVVIPDSFTFVMSNITAPYTKTVSLDVVAKYGYTEVALKSSDVVYKLSNDALGTIIDGKFTATSDETLTEGTVTATLIHNSSLSAVANITLGKGSEVVYDFENGSESIANWKLAYKGSYTPDKYYFNDEISVASVADGAKVRNGEYALKVTVDGDSITCMNWCQTKIQGMNIDLTDAVSLSFWIYIPEGSHGLEWDFGNAIPVVLGHEFQYGTGWQYLTVNVKDIGTNVTNLNEIRLYHSDTNNAGNGYNHYENPNYYADVVYYIDDITVNYSSAVEDNDAPVISGVSVSHANIDTPVAVNGQDVDANVVAFVADATDNVGLTNFTGLNRDSLAVYVDGKQIEATCSENGRITTSDIELANGVHTVVIRISDNNGNQNTYIEYNINIVGNDDADTIKYQPADPTLKDVPNGSVVWMDLVATSIDKVSKIETTIDLDQNNKWELDHMILAEGFSATYTVDTETNDATIIITADGNVKLNGEAVVASLPIRVWTPAFWLSGGNEDAHAYRLVSVMTYVQSGELIATDSKASTFSSDMKVTTTEWNSTRLTSTFDKDGWHIHTAEALADKEASCTVEGYTGRTFCEECNSVVEWGTTVPKKDHDFDADGQCNNCDAVNNANGLTVIDGKWYFLANGVAQGGWQIVGDDWYYFDPETKIGAEGDLTLDSVTYNFVNGKLTSGVWIRTLYGYRYYYGPKYYGQGNRLGVWANIDGKDYFFEGNTGYRLQGGWQLILESSVYRNWYYFDENGVCADKNLKPDDGFYTDRNGLAYSKDGQALMGEQKIDGKYYYFDDIFGYAQKGQLAGRLYGEDYAAYTGLLEKDGVMYYYLDGRTGPCGLVKVDDCYYYSYWGGVIKTGEHYVSNTYCDLPAGQYRFGDDGKALNGIYDSVLYANGQKAAEGLYNIDGEYYLAGGNGSFSKDGTYYVSVSHCELPAGRNYTFGPDGKMYNGVEEVDGKLYLYKNGTTVTYGLYEVDGEYYYANWGGVIMTNGRYYVSTSFCDLSANQNYSFGADGKMLNGVEEVDGELYLYVNGTTAPYGLYIVDGEYYYANWGGVIMTDGTYYVSVSHCELPAGRNYTFGSDGKMYNGVEEVDGKLYLYKNGTTVTYGLYEVDGEYYYANWGGVIMTNGRYYVSTSFCDLSANQNYSFGADGKMLNGVEEIDGKLYLYKNGTTVTYGLYKVDGEYYYANWGGVLMTDGTFYVSTSCCDLSENRNYTFGVDGKMLNGFINKTDGIYYYENGNTPAPKILFIDGHYYYVSWGGKLVTNGVAYVPADGIYTDIPLTYKFNELGQLIK